MKPFLLGLVVTMVQALEDHCSHKLDNHYWSTDLKSCLPCTNCHDQRLITIIGCAPDKDTICGTIEDLRHQWLLPSLKNGDSINSKAFMRKSKKSIESEEVYGRTRFRPSTNDKKASSSYGSATQKVKESVKNSSQKKLEFLKKLQEIENISVLPRKPKSTINHLENNEPSEEIDGTVHFTQDEYYKKQDALHQDLELIEQELMKENDALTSTTVATATTLKATKSLQQKESYSSVTEELSPTISVWFNGNKGVMETLQSTTETSELPGNNDYVVPVDDDYVGQQTFFATGESFRDNGPDVFGAVVHEAQPKHVGTLVGSSQADEFGLLTSILYRQPNTSTTIPSNSSMEKSQYISMKVEHIMVIAGFCIGFGMVICVAIVYFRLKPMDRFKNPRHHSAVDNTSLSSGNSSFLPQTDSRLTSLTASPLLSQAQSPLLPIRENTTNNNSALTSPILTDASPSVLNVPNSRHSVIVDQRGRTSLKPTSRELPV